jgi:hypothetical protein
MTDAPRARISANTGQKPLDYCHQVRFTAAMPYTGPTDLVFDILVRDRSFQVRDYGFQVRVEPLPDLQRGVRIGMATCDADRTADAATARDLALAVMEQAGFLIHGGDNAHHLDLDLEHA